MLRHSQVTHSTVSHSGMNQPHGLARTDLLSRLGSGASCLKVNFDSRLSSSRKSCDERSMLRPRAKVESLESRSDASRTSSTTMSCTDAGFAEP